MVYCGERCEVSGVYVRCGSGLVWFGGCFENGF